MNRYSTLKRRTGLQQRSSLARTGTLKQRTSLKAKKSINRIGKIGQSNIKARKDIARKAEKKNLKTCEAGPELLRLGIRTGCTKTWPLAPAHRHKRAYYKGDPDLLAADEQWIAACTNCHDRIEHDPELTEQIFLQLRGPE